MMKQISHDFREFHTAINSSMGRGKDETRTPKKVIHSSLLLFSRIRMIKASRHDSKVIKKKTWAMQVFTFKDVKPYQISH